MRGGSTAPHSQESSKDAQNPASPACREAGVCGILPENVGKSTDPPKSMLLILIRMILQFIVRNLPLKNLDLFIYFLIIILGNLGPL